jgi:hypothetical protein
MAHIERYNTQTGTLIEYWHVEGLCLTREEMLTLLRAAEQTRVTADDDDTEVYDEPVTILRRQTSSRPTAVRFPFEKTEERRKMMRLIENDDECIVEHVIQLIIAGKKNVERVQIDSLSSEQVQLVTGMCQIAGLESYVNCKTEMRSVFCSFFNTDAPDRCGCANVPVEALRTTLKTIYKLPKDFDYSDRQKLDHCKCKDPDKEQSPIVYEHQFVDGVVVLLTRTPRTPREITKTPPLPMNVSK